MSPSEHVRNDGRRDFDFLHGEWQIHNRRLARRLEGSHEWQDFPSQARVWPILLGLGNADTISIPNLPGTGPFEGFTVRLFDPATGLWTIFWAASAAPGKLDPPLKGRFSEGHGTFHGADTFDGRPIRVRFEWHHLSDDAARWEQSFSDDDCGTWELNWVMDFTRAAER